MSGRSRLGFRGGALLLLALLFPAADAQAKVTRYLTGNAADVAPALAGPAHDFGGGGTDVDAALQWIIDRVRGCTSCATKVDVVILRSTGSNGYNDYIYAMNGVDSVETLVVTSARDANTAAVETTVRNAEVVFFAGGDQCDYVKNFRGTRVETAVESVYARGGGVGGTSAGLAIMGEFTYDACSGSVTSSQALLDPYHRYISFTYDFFNWPNLQGVITDSHFVTRDRMGRTMAFVARQIRDGRAATALGMAVNEATSVVVDKNGLATVIGGGPAYFVLGDHFPEVCESGTPLTYSNFKIWKVPAGGTFNLAARPTTGFYLVSVNNGLLSGDPY
ncbi:MAG TPA: Type 1 glutamine amidotransferase-like domain-containing protein [Pyrinomonadaceae bacterium]|jgi:cyanophycinase|nr:Type 1 glutamine amidotransferase-like domain-containing protein [Pyrinomonadaceae bacterium]